MGESCLKESENEFQRTFELMMFKLFNENVCELNASAYLMKKENFA